MTRAAVLKKLFAWQLRKGVPPQIPATSWALGAAYDLGRAQGLRECRPYMVGIVNRWGVSAEKMADRLKNRALARMEERDGE